MTLLQLIRQALSPHVKLRRWAEGAGGRRHRWETRAGFVARVTRPVLVRARIVGSDYREVGS